MAMAMAIVVGAIASNDHGNIRITSYGKGVGSTVVLRNESGTHALALFGTGLVRPGHNTTFDSATSGSFTGFEFHGYDFSAYNEDLVVVIDGHNNTVHLTDDILTVESAVAALAGLSGAVVSAHDGNIMIVSSTTGSDSTVTIDVAHSGAHAVGLFGTGVEEHGHDANAGGSSGHDDGLCHELHTAPEDAIAGLPSLWSNHFYYDRCYPYGYADYQFTVTATDDHGEASSASVTITVDSEPDTDDADGGDINASLSVNNDDIVFV